MFTHTCTIRNHRTGAICMHSLVDRGRGAPVGVHVVVCDSESKAAAAWVAAAGRDVRPCDVM